LSSLHARNISAATVAGLSATSATAARAHTHAHAHAHVHDTPLAAALAAQASALAAENATALMPRPTLAPLPHLHAHAHTHAHAHPHALTHVHTHAHAHGHVHNPSVHMRHVGMPQLSRVRTPPMLGSLQPPGSGGFAPPVRSATSLFCVVFVDLSVVVAPMLRSLQPPGSEGHAPPVRSATSPVRVVFCLLVCCLDISVSSHHYAINHRSLCLRASCRTTRRCRLAATCTDTHIHSYTRFNTHATTACVRARRVA
jgi:hypothetical protein